MDVKQINANTEDRLQALEMDFWRRSVDTSRLDRVRNDRIKRIMDVETTIVEDIKQKQLCWYGHVQKMGEERIPKQMLQ